MPFIVDSVTMELSRGRRTIHQLVHPVVQIRVDDAGRPVEVLPGNALPEAGHAGAGRADEIVRVSCLHVEVDRQTDAAELTQLTTDLQRVLSDVRAAVRDWPAMQARLWAVVQEYTDDPPALVDPDEVRESVELLRWLATEHFTLLGFREYELTDEDVLEPISDTGLGILRQADNDAHKLPPEVAALAARARSHEGELPSHGAPTGLPRLHRRETVRRGRKRHRRMAVPRAVHLRRVQQQPVRDSRGA
jgi:glutamate dehydrogenase